MAGGSVYDFIRMCPNTLELPVLLKIAIDICKGMEYLHQNGIIHRDLKTANLLMDADGVRVYLLNSYDNICASHLLFSFIIIYLKGASAHEEYLRSLKRLIIKLKFSRYA